MSSTWRCFETEDVPLSLCDVLLCHREQGAPFLITPSPDPIPLLPNTPNTAEQNTQGEPPANTMSGNGGDKKEEKKWEPPPAPTVGKKYVKAFL